MRRAWCLCLALALCAPGVARPQGEPLGDEFRVNTYTTGTQYSTDVAANPGGNFVVVWTDSGQDGSGFGVFGQRFGSSGAPLGPEFRVNSYTTNFQWLASVAADSASNFVVVWTSHGQDGSYGGVFGQRFASAGTPLGPEFRINTYTTDYQDRPAVAADSAGNFVVVWGSHDQDGSYRGVFGQRFASGGAPLGPEFRVNTYTTDDQDRPAVAADPAGNFIVVWNGLGPDDSGIFGQRYASNGPPLGPEFRINSYTTNGQSFPDVAAAPGGDLVVLWTGQGQGDSLGVFGQRFSSSGAPLGPEFRVNTFTTLAQTHPSVATDSAGNFVVAWENVAGSMDVFGQRYASDGTPAGPEFRINTYIPFDAQVPAVAADAAGNFVVAWDNYGQDGSGRTVLGQRYGRIVPVELLHFGVE